jgi:hypothetical protein
MTNIAKLLSGISFFGLLLATPLYADEVCPQGAFAGEIQDTLDKAGVTIQELSPEATAAIVHHRGDTNPPNTKDGFHFVRLERGGMVQYLAVSKEGCITIAIPSHPAPANVVDQFMAGAIDG